MSGSGLVAIKALLHFTTGLSYIPMLAWCNTLTRYGRYVLSDIRRKMALCAECRTAQSLCYYPPRS